MADFGPLGGVKITGFISPTDTVDTFAVIDPLYGIDGLRNITGDTSELNNVTPLRRRAGMFVGVSGGTEYYKLKDIAWQYDATSMSAGTDWDVVEFGIDTFISGMTFNNGTYDLTIHRNDGFDFTQSLSILASDMVVTGGTYQPTTGIVEFTNNSGGTFGVSGFTTGMTNYYTTGSTLIGSTVFFDRSDSLSAYTVDLSSLGVAGSTLVPLIYNQALAVPNTSIQPAFGGSVLTSASVFSNILGGSGHTITSSPNSSIVGGKNGLINYSDYSNIGGGRDGVINYSNSSTIGGGVNNYVRGYNSIIGGGKDNTISGSSFGYYSFGNTIAGGGQNILYRATGGTQFLTAYSTIGGGYRNKMSSTYGSVIGGGTDNSIINNGIYGYNLAPYSFIGGGKNNNILIDSSDSTTNGWGNSIVGGYFIGNGILAGVKISVTPFSNGGNNQIIHTGAGVSMNNFIGGGTLNAISANTLTASEYQVTNTILNGIENRIYGNTWASTIVAGQKNQITNSFHGVIGGGLLNTVTDSNYSFIGNGSGHVMSGSPYSFIGGGAWGHTMSGSPYSFIGGGKYDIINNSTNSSIIGGEGNIIERGTFTYAPLGSVGGQFTGVTGNVYNTPWSGGSYNNRTGNRVSYSNVTTGQTPVWDSFTPFSSVTNDYAFIGGGKNNIIGGVYAWGTQLFPPGTGVIAGGYGNYSTGYATAIGGGGSNEIKRGWYSTIGGGGLNKIYNNAFTSVIAGGYENKISHKNDSFSGGTGGSDSGYMSIGGGFANEINTSPYSTIGGGGNNTIENNNSSVNYSNVIAGGEGNLITDGSKNFVGGGEGNRVIGGAIHSSVVGGDSNLIGGGTGNTISGGKGNSINAPFNNVIGGGNGNGILGGVGYHGYGNVIVGGGGTGELAQNDIRWASYSFLGTGKASEITTTFGITRYDGEYTWSDYSAIIAGPNNRILDSTSAFIGTSGNFSDTSGNDIQNSDYGAIIGGSGNLILDTSRSGLAPGIGEGPYYGASSIIGGGAKNTIYISSESMILNGYKNFVGVTYLGNPTYPGGGWGGQIYPYTSGNQILNGRENIIGGAYQYNSQIFNGSKNKIKGPLGFYSVVTPTEPLGSEIYGITNQGNEYNNTIIGGKENEVAESQFSTIIGGGRNSAGGSRKGNYILGANNGFISSGYENLIISKPISRSNLQNEKLQIIGGNRNVIRQNVADGLFKDCLDCVRERFNTTRPYAFKQQNIVVDATGSTVTFTHNLYDDTIDETIIAVTDGTPDIYVSGLTDINTIYPTITSTTVSNQTLTSVDITFNTNGSGATIAYILLDNLKANVRLDNVSIVGGSDNLVNNSINTSVINSRTSVVAFSDGVNIFGGENNIVVEVDDVHIIGSNITAVSANTTHVNNLNIYNSPLVDNSLTDLIVRDTDGTVKIRQATSISGATGTTGSLTAKFAVTSAFVTDTPVTINHNMGLAGGDEFDILVQLRDTVGGDQVGATIDNFTSNTVDVTFSQNYSAVRVVIIG